MEDISKLPLGIVCRGSNSTLSQGLKTVKVKNKCFIWIWCGFKISVYEGTIQLDQEALVELPRDPLKRSEVNLNGNVIDIFQKNNCVYALDENGIFYSLEFTTSNPENYMEVEDLFCSPTTSDNVTEWKGTVMNKVSECEQVKNVCALSSGLAILAVNDGHLNVVVYSFPEVKFEFLVDLEKYKSQDAVLSSCAISLLSPKLKQCFKEHLEVFDEEIIVVGLASGILLWFCTNNPSKGPFVLFNTYQEIQSIHWIKDSSSGLFIYLLAVLKSGQLVVFEGEEYSILYLPDSVKSSCCLNSFLITSNLVDCYASKIVKDKNITLNCISLPVKGVCAMASAPGSDALLVAATIHGSLYCFDPTIAPPENASPFTLPDQSLLDNMFLQSQNLESLYKELNHEEDIIKAVTASIAVKSGKNVFQIEVQVVSDGVFSITAEIIGSKIIFLSTLWTVCVEVINESGQKETSFHKMEHNFSSNNILLVNVGHRLSVNDNVTVELIYFIESAQPVVIIPVGKLKIDACHLMCSQSMTHATTKTEETLKSILDDMENQQPKQSLAECKLKIKLLADYPVISLFKKILACSQQRFSHDEWDKISSGKKLNVSMSISNFPVVLKLEVESKELIVISCNTKLCHQVREAVVARLKHAVKQNIPEDLTLKLQAIHQTFEIESLNEKPNGEALDEMRKNLRDTISAHLAV